MNIIRSAGWVVRHKSERTVYLVKEDWAYREALGRDGFVLTRKEPGATDEDLMNDALIMCEVNDERIGLMLGEKLLPPEWKAQERAKKYQDGDLLVSAGTSKVVPLREYRRMQAVLAGVFATPEDPQIKIYRP